MRLARTLGYMPHLRQLAPTARSRVVRRRRQWNLSTGVEQPPRGVSSVDVKATLADQTPVTFSLMLWVARALIAGLAVVTLIPNLFLGAIFCAGHLFAELRGKWRGRRIAQAIGSMPQLRRQFVPTERSRARTRPLQRNFNTAIEKPPQGISWVNVQTLLADQKALIRALVSGLVLVALIPNFMLGAIFWLSAADTARTRPSTITANDRTVAPPTVPKPVLSSPPTLEASAGGDITFPIALDGTDGVPARSIIAIKGLPQGSKLSSGRAYDETEWNLKPDEIGDLHLIVPNTASGEAKLLIQLVATDGAIISDTTTALNVIAKSTANVGVSSIDAELNDVQAVEDTSETRGTTGAEFANVDAAMAASGDSVPLPTKRPSQASNDNGNSIALTFVNLRLRPTRSARAIGVVAKDAKLRVLARKNRWVQVTNLATSEKGWIYAPHVATDADIR
jgi:hypothetical protein